MNRFHSDPITNILLEGMLLENPIYKDSYRASKLLIEYAMTPDQITKAFAQAEQGMAASGQNRTMVGKAADTTGAAAQAISKGWDKVKTSIQNSGPVSGFDQKFAALQDNLLQAAGGEGGAVGKAIKAYRDFAKAHPVMQGAIYAGLVALAGISGAGLGGAAILGGIKIMDRLLQGDKASSALWQGFKTGATAYGAGQVGQAMQGSAPLSPNAGSPAGDFGGGTMAGSTDVTTVGSPAGDAAGGTGGGVDTYTPGAEQGSPAGDTGGVQGDTTATQAAAAASDQGSGVISAQDAATQQAAAASDAGNLGGGAPSTDYVVKKGDTLSAIAQKNKVSIQDLMKANPDITNPNVINVNQHINVPAPTGNAIYQGGVGTAADTAKKVASGVYKASKIRESRFIDYGRTYQQWRLDESAPGDMKIYLNEEGVKAVFYLVHEGMWDTIKGAAGKVAGAVKQKVAQVGSNLTNKITADKLNKAWMQGPGFSYDGQAKSVDSQTVQAFLIKQGVEQSVAANAVKAVASGAGAAAAPAAAGAAKTRTGGRQAGQPLSQTANAIRKRASYAAKKTGAAAPAAATPAAPVAAAKPRVSVSNPATGGFKRTLAPAAAAPAAESKGETGPKFTGYWKGKDKGKPGKKMVGSD